MAHNDVADIQARVAAAITASREKWGAAFHMRLATLEAALRPFVESVERETAYRAKPKGGQRVDNHGDWCSAMPTVMSRLEWWARTMRAALTKGSTDGK